MARCSIPSVAPSPGSVSRARGPARVSVQGAGSASVHFESENSATFTYRLNEGTQGSTAIVRELFASSDTTTRGSYLADLWWNPDESGWGVAVCEQFGSVFA